MPMSRAKTIFLLVGLLLAISGAGAGVWWWKNGDEFLAGLRNRGKANFEEGQRIGRKARPFDCLQAATGRAGNCSSTDMLCEINARMFMKGCLSETQTLPQFCGGLPPYEERPARLGWAVQTCTQLGRSDERCWRVLNDASVICAQRKESSQ